MAGGIACTGFFDLGRVAAIDLLDGTAVSVEEGETRQLRARAVTAGGDSVPDATIQWERVDVDSGATSFTIDSTGLVVGLAPGTGQVVASVEDLRTNPVVVTVTAQPDLVQVAGALRHTVPVGDTVSSALAVRVVDLTTTPGDTLALADKLVHYVIVDPATVVDVALAQPDSAPGSDPAFTAAVTDGAGTATAVVYRQATMLDSTVVEATALTAGGTAVSGSPVRFVVIFQHQ